jgi:hypothetical protein
MRGGAASFELVHASTGVEMTENAGKKKRTWKVVDGDRVFGKGHA